MKEYYGLLIGFFRRIRYRLQAFARIHTHQWIKLHTHQRGSVAVESAAAAAAVGITTRRVCQRVQGGSKK